MATERVASKTKTEARRRVVSRFKSDFMGSMTSVLVRLKGAGDVHCTQYQYSQRQGMARIMVAGSVGAIPGMQDSFSRS